MKSFVIFFLTLLSITSGLAQTDCTLKIVYSLNKNLPPSYGFTTDPQIENAKYYWSFSDNFVSDSPTPVHGFATTGSYVIEVKVVKENQICYGRIEANFEGNSTTPVILSAKGKVLEKTGCGLVIALDNTTILVPKEIIPNFTLKPGQYVEIAYELMNTTSECGKPVKIHKIAEITQVCSVPITIEKGDRVGFYSFKTSEQPAGTTFKWYFSDKTTSDSPTPIHEFKTSGSYVIELLVTKPDGTKCNGRIEARFEGSTQTSTIYSAKGKVIEKTGCNLLIALENASVLVPVELVPAFTLKPGQYVEVAYELLDKANECGKAAKIHKIAEIIQVCNVPITVGKGDRVGFYSFKTSEQPAGTIFKWYFSDKTTSDSPTPIHEFKTSGSYVIELLVTKPDGTKCNGRIEARFEGSTHTSTIFSANGKVKRPAVAGCDLVIALENGTILIPAKIATDFKLEENQYVEITFEKLADKITTCNEGIEASILTIKRIDNTTACKAYFTAVNVADAAGVITRKVEFTNKTGGEIRELKWNFGDNTTETSVSTSFVHEYAVPGEYQVCLSIATTTGCTSSYCAKVNVGTASFNDCKFDIVIKPKEASPKTFLFSTVSNFDIKTWKWNFGDGTVSELKDPEHTYEKPGSYEITCSVVSAAGCNATKTFKHFVPEASLPVCKGAISLILIDPTDNKCNGKATIKLVNENFTEVDGVKYIWNDGKTGSVNETLCPDKTYFVQALIEGLCQKNTSFTMMSKPVWRATTINGINNFKVVDPKEGVQYEWNFGNGVSLKGAEINYDFEKDGVYNVKLTATIGSETSEYSQQIVVLKSITGTSIINKSEIQIFPNPVSDILNISFGNPVENEFIIDITSMSGQKVYSGKMNTAGTRQINIDLQSLKQGIYFLRITNDNYLIANKKFVKN